MCMWSHFATLTKSSHKYELGEGLLRKTRSPVAHLPRCSQLVGCPVWRVLRHLSLICPWSCRTASFLQACHLLRLSFAPCLLSDRIPRTSHRRWKPSVSCLWSSSRCHRTTEAGVPHHYSRAGQRE